MKKQISISSKDNLNNNDIIWPTKKEQNLKNNNNKYFPDVIFVEKKLEINEENKSNKNKIKRVSTNPIDNYLNNFLNKEEKKKQLNKSHKQIKNYNQNLNYCK